MQTILGIQDVYYTPILDGLDIMDTPASIGQVKEEIRTCDENMN